MERRLRVPGWMLRAVVLVLLLACATPASATRGHVFASSFGSEGAGPGQFTEPSGVAVNEATHDVYVVDKGNNRVERFDQNGNYLGQFDGSGKFEIVGASEPEKEGTAAPTGALSFPTVIAVDNSCALHQPAPLTEATTPTCKEADESNGDVYVPDRGHGVIDKFTPLGEFVGQLTGAAEGTPFEELSGVSTDTAGNLWVFQGGGFSTQVDNFNNHEVNEFIASRVPTVPAGFVSGAAFAVDKGDNFYAVAESEARQSVAKFSPGGALLNSAVGGELFGGEAFGGAAVDLSTNDLYVDQVTSIAQYAPNGSLLKRFGGSQPGQLVGGRGVGVDTSNEATYVADATANVVNVYDQEPTAKPAIEGEATSNVTGDSAVLEAEVNPRSVASEARTTYHFEYGPCNSSSTCSSAPYGAVLPQPDGTLPADFELHQVAEQAANLQSQTTYHFRLVAENSHGSTPGEEHQFTTQGASSSLVLLNGRAWEMVSPIEKHGALIETIGQAHVTQAAASGNAITYTAVTPTESNPNGSTNQVQVISTRQGSGWSSKDVSLANDAATGLTAGQEYRMFSPELASAIVQPLGSFTPHSALATEQTPYLRQEALCASEAASSECFRPLVTGSNVPSGTEFGACRPGEHVVCGPIFAGASPDLKEVAVSSPVALTNVPLPPEQPGLYEWTSDGHLTLVSVLPGGGEQPAGNNAELGFRNRDARNAITDGGNRVIWTEKEGERHLYMRDIARKETLELDAVQGGSGEHGAAPVFQFASDDGTRVFFTDDQRLTPNSGGGGDEVNQKENDLYECDIVVEPGGLRCQLTDITPLKGSEEAHVQNLLPGGSETNCDANSGQPCNVYFVANGALTENEGAVHGNCAGNSSVSSALCNLYEAHRNGTGWETRLVAVLSAEDYPDWNGHSAETFLASLTTRVSPDGQWLAFMSQRNLTGYDTRDAFSGHPAEEVYLYHAMTSPAGALEPGTLTCASCNPSGSRPVGKEYAQMKFGADGIQVWTQPGQTLAGSLPAWTSYSQVGLARYQTRYLSDSGRLFFNSNDSLVPQDVNETGDVYEYEPVGASGSAGCTEQSTTFSARSGGCVGLMSSGASPQESVFLDASENGSDAFFLTAAQLAGFDHDTSYDVYDARVCSEASPCFSQNAPTPSAACASADECKPTATGQPNIFGAPPSATLTTPAQAPAAQATPTKAKPLTRAQKLARALKSCRKKANKKKRRACEAAARKKYGPKANKGAKAGKRRAPAKSSNHRGGALAMKRSYTLVAIAGLALLVFGVGSASARTPWWSLDANARPTSLRTGQASNEIQTLTVSATSGNVVLIAPEEKGVAFVPFNVSHRVLQEKLEGVFGAGNVEVPKGEGNAAGDDPYEIVFVGGLADQPAGMLSVFPSGLEGGKASATLTETAKGRPDGYVAVTATDIGDVAIDGGVVPVSIADRLPQGVHAVAIEGLAGNRDLAPVTCTLGSLTCTYSNVLPIFKDIEVRIAVVVEGGAASGGINEVSISGGETRGVSIRRPIAISNAPVPFGISSYALSNEEEGGATDTQAGTHPFQQTTRIVVNQTLDQEGNPVPASLAKDFEFKWPPGLIGNPNALPDCSLGQFLRFEGIDPENECPAQSAVGVAVATISEPAGEVGTKNAFTFTAPVFNLEPAKGEPARFGFVVPGSPVIIDASVRSGEDYGVTIHVHNVTQTASLLSSTVTIWGVPGDSRHDNARGYGCLLGGSCNPLEMHEPPAFLQLPTQCGSNTLETSVTADPWNQQGVFTAPVAEVMPALTGCNRVPFSSTLDVVPDTSATSSSAGLKVDLHVPQEGSVHANGIAEAAAKNITVTLPEGLTVNPAGADGLGVCSEGLVGFRGFANFGGANAATFTGVLPEPLQSGVNFCPEASKIGSATIKTPVLPNPIKGGVYLATQNQNPFGTLLAMYVVGEAPVSGVVVKLAGAVHLSATGQIVTTFENSPQAPFEDAVLEFFGGNRAPLATPTHCGSYTTEASISPWSNGEVAHPSSTFALSSGPHGSPCPAGPLPYSPSLTGGTTNANAGAFSPFTTSISREDGDQALGSVQLRPPAGLEGVLKGVALCPEAQANAGTCGPESQIGEATVSAGVGANPITVNGGRVYLTEKYAGAPFGLSIVSPVKAGPFDLEHDTASAANQPACDCFVVRAKIEVDPTTAELTVTTDTAGAHQIPQIIDGVPVQLRNVNVTINRDHFTFNPTSCTALSLTSNIGSAEEALHPASEPFQTANCGTLKYTPTFTASVGPKSTKANGVGLVFKIAYPAGAMGKQSWFRKVKIDLPKQLPARLTTLQKACLAAVFEANPAACPSASLIGRAVVHTPVLPVPLAGPVYFVSYGNAKFPDAVMLLQGYGITIKLRGETFISKAGITSATFSNTPDVPFENLEVTVPSGPFSEFTAILPTKAKGNLCGQKLVMPTLMEAQNGIAIHQNTPIGVTGCRKKAGQTRAQKLAAALRSCRKKAKAKRPSCERQARKRYGAPKRRHAGTKSKKK